MCVCVLVCALCADISGYEQVFCNPVEDRTILAYLGRQYKDLVLWPKTKTYTRSETKWGKESYQEFLASGEHSSCVCGVCCVC